MDASARLASFWTSDDEWIGENPLWSDPDLAELHEFRKHKNTLPGHIWIASSGSRRQIGESKKWIALSKNAMLISAQAVNSFYKIQEGDVWALALPVYHVGGLSIFARAHLSSSPVAEFNQKWNPTQFQQHLIKHRVHWTSLVPTQVFDLVQQGLSAPKDLKGVIVGGQVLDPELFDRAVGLGWPLSVTFGMTETCSQIASSRVGSRDLEVLDHVQVRVDSDHRLMVKTEALMSGFQQKKSESGNWGFTKPLLQDGFWQTSDRAQILVGSGQSTHLKILGRDGDFIKIKGEGLSLSDLRMRFANFLRQEFSQSWDLLDPATSYLLDVFDPRDGLRIVLVAERGANVAWESVVHRWNQNCFPIERINLIEVPQIPRSDLGKVLENELRLALKGS